MVKSLVFTGMSVLERALGEIRTDQFMEKSIRPSQMNTASVFVVDDDIAICRIIHRMLSIEQYKVQTSQSVAGALHSSTLSKVGGAPRYVLRKR